VTHGVTQKAKRKAKKNKSLAPDLVLRDSSLPSESPSSEIRHTTSAQVVEGFERFWAAHPRKVDKLAAERAFAKALERGASAEAMIRGAQAYAVQREPVIGFLAAEGFGALESPDLPVCSKAPTG
jgi:hypothetical protein